MKMRGLLIAAIILAALSGTLYWSNRHKSAESTVSASVAKTAQILSLKAGDITGIDIKKAGQTDVALQKSDGVWKITRPQPLSADQQSVSSVTSTLSSLNADRVIEEKAADLKPFGLADPALEVDVTLKDNKTSRLQIGDPTPSGSDYYAKLAGDPRVFTIASYNKSSVDKSAEDLRDKRLLTADLDKASQIQVSAPKQDVTFARNKDEWQILKPGPWRADSFAVDELVQTLKDAKMDTAPSADDAKKNAAAFNSGKPVATVKVSVPAGTQTLQLRKDKDAYYAKSSAVEGIYKVSGTLASGLDKKVDDFRNKKLFDFGYETPDKIEIQDGGKSYYLTHGGEDWWGPDGKKLDSSSAEDVLGKIRDLAADKFPDSGFGTPSIQITVISKNNKVTEKVLFAKSGDTYIAKRDGEPALYALEPVLVTSLEKAAADLKPAPLPASEKKK
jgi:hypothetical protein